MLNKDIAIIGAGSFGNAVIKFLIDCKVNITVFEKVSQKANLLQSKYSQINCIILDTTNSNFLKENGIESFDCVIIAIGNDLQSSLLTASNLLDLNTNQIIARANNETHEKILKKMGVKNIINNDLIAGEIIAKKAAYGIESHIQILDEEFAIIKINAQANDVIGKTFEELEIFPNNKDYNVLRIWRKGKILYYQDINKIALNDKIVFVTKLKKANELQLKFQGIQDE